MLSAIAEERGLPIVPDEFVGRAVSHPLFGLMRWYFKSEGAICFSTGLAIRHAMGKKYQLENDHIFPYSKLEKRGYGRENRVKYALAQELTNRAILTQIANRTKATTEPEDYLRSVNSKFPGALELQCVPEDETLWKLENYEQFLGARRQLLAKKLNAFLEGITETEETTTPVSLEDLIAEGESDSVELKSSLRWDYKEQCVNKKLEEVIVKSVAAFANGQGGTLLIGVADNGEILGLESDYAGLGDRDKFELHLRNVSEQPFWRGPCSNQIADSLPLGCRQRHLPNRHLAFCSNNSGQISRQKRPTARAVLRQKWEFLSRAFKERHACLYQRAHAAKWRESIGKGARDTSEVMTSFPRVYPAIERSFATSLTSAQRVLPAVIQQGRLCRLALDLR